MSHTHPDDHSETLLPSGKIHPEWGRTVYKKPGCTSYRIEDDRMHQKLLGIVAREKVKLREAGFVLKLNQTPCLNCLHLKNGSCTYTEGDINRTAAQYKKSPIHCRHCGAINLNFHYFLLQSMGGGGGKGLLYTCDACQHAEQHGELSEHLTTRQKDARLTKGLQLLELIFLLLIAGLKISYEFLYDSAYGFYVLVGVAISLFITLIIFLVVFVKSMRAHRRIKMELKNRPAKHRY